MTELQKAAILLNAGAVAVDSVSRSRFDWIFRGPTVRVSKYTMEKLIEALKDGGFDFEAATR